MNRCLKCGKKHIGKCVFVPSPSVIEQIRGDVEGLKKKVKSTTGSEGGYEIPEGV